VTVADPYPFLDQALPLAIAHRGGAGDWPENTLPAFEGAVALGFTHLETDVHVTSDGVLLAFHDESLDRVTDRTGLIREQPWADVAAARVDGREPIPRFEELLRSFPDAFFNVDPKHDGSVETLARVIHECHAVERVCIGSFSDRRIARLRELLGPALCTSLGPRGVARLRSAGYGIPARGFAAPCVQVPPTAGGVPLVDHRFVRTAHHYGLQVHVWTIDEPAEMTRLLDLGVDAIMTDRPAVLKQLLIDRGQWTGRTATPS
jgi:glycerophosphoryl diester phosphodiesterase